MDGSEADEAAILAVLQGGDRGLAAAGLRGLGEPLGAVAADAADVCLRFLRRPGGRGLGRDRRAASGPSWSRFPEKTEFEGQVRWENVNVVIDGTMAWVDLRPDRRPTPARLPQAGSRISRSLHRIDGAWKLSCMVMMESTVEQASCPLIEVDADARVLWTNPLARERMRGHPGLVVAAGRLRARHRERDAALREAVRLASQRAAEPAPADVGAEAGLRGRRSARTTAGCRSLLGAARGRQGAGRPSTTPTRSRAGSPGRRRSTASRRRR